MAKRALLVGCNYEGTRFSLRGCIHDADTMGSLIVSEFGFEMGDVKVLTDGPRSSVLPTGKNIKSALREMVTSARAGDVLFFYFSGHGTALPAFGRDRFREEEAIVPCDLNIITDTDLREIICLLAEGVSFTILSDSCHSGALIDKGREQIGFNLLEMKPKPFQYMTRPKSIDFTVICDMLYMSRFFDETRKSICTVFYNRFQGDASRRLISNDVKEVVIPEDKVILMSGCEANQTSFDILPNGKAYGAFTHAVQQVVNKHSGESITNKQLVAEARQILRDNGFEQLPCLYCNKSNANAPFLGGVA